MVEAGIGLALGFHGGGIPHHVAGGQGLAVHHRDHPVHARAVADLRPAEGGHQGLGQGQSTGFHHDAVEAVGALQQAGHGGQKLVLDRAAETAVGEFHQAVVEFVIRAEAAGGDQVAVDAHLTELIDQNSQPQAALQQQMAQQGGLAGPQKTGHHRDRQTSGAGGRHQIGGKGCTET